MTTTPAPHIASLNASNLKLPSLSLALSRLTWISGRNGSGKTTIVDALQLVGMGHVPRIGKNGPALASLAGPGLEMSVGATLSDGTTIDRAWTRTATGMSKAKGTEVPDLLPVFSLNPEALLAMNEDEMARTIAARFGLEGDPVAKLTTAMGKVVKTATLPKVKKYENFADWCQQMETAIAASLKEQRDTARRFKATVEGMTAIEAAPVATVTTEAVDPDELAAAQTAAGAAYQRMQDATHALAESSRRLDRLPAEDPTPAPELSRAALEEEKAGLLAEIAKLQEKQRAAAAGSERRANDAKLLEQLETRSAGIELWLSNNENGPDEVTGEPLTAPAPEEVQLADDAYAAAAKLSTQNASTLEVLLSQQTTGDVCGCCGAKRENWDETKTWEAEEKLELAKTSATESRGRAERLLAIRDELKARAARALDDVAARLARATWEKERAQYLTRAEEVAALQKEIEGRVADVPLFDMDEAEALAGYQSSLSDVEADLATWDAHEASQARLAAINAERETNAAAYRAEEAATAEHTEAAARRDELRAKADAASAAAAAQAKANAEAEAAAKALAEATKTHTEAEAAAKEWAAIQAAFEEEARKITEEIFAPLLALAHPITADCLPTPLGHKGLAFGRWVGPHFVNLSTFSKSEQVAAVAGISAALASKGRGIVIIDEFNNLDADKQPLMVANLSACLEFGTISQAILLDNSTVPPKLPPFGSMVRL